MLVRVAPSGNALVDVEFFGDQTTYSFIIDILLFETIQLDCVVCSESIRFLTGRLLPFRSAQYHRLVEESTNSKFGGDRFKQALADV